jgi:hypothetical protein
MQNNHSGSGAVIYDEVNFGGNYNNSPIMFAQQGNITSNSASRGSDKVKQTITQNQIKSVETVTTVFGPTDWTVEILHTKTFESDGMQTMISANQHIVNNQSKDRVVTKESFNGSNNINTIGRSSYVVIDDLRSINFFSIGTLQVIDDWKQRMKLLIENSREIDSSIDPGGSTKSNCSDNSILDQNDGSTPQSVLYQNDGDGSKYLIIGGKVGSVSSNGTVSGDGGSKYSISNCRIGSVSNNGVFDVFNEDYEDANYLYPILDNPPPYPHSKNSMKEVQTWTIVEPSLEWKVNTLKSREIYNGKFNITIESNQHVVENRSNQRVSIVKVENGSISKCEISSNSLIMVDFGAIVKSFTVGSMEIASEWKKQVKMVSNKND